MRSRRDLLRTGGLAVAGGLAGCSTDPPAPPEFRIGERKLMNTHEQPHSGTVFLFDDGEPVYRETIEAEAASGNQAGGGAFEGYPTEPGWYELYGWHGAAGEDEWARLAFDPDSFSGAGDEPPCVEVILMIETGEAERAHSAFLRSVGCDDAQSSR